MVIPPEAMKLLKEKGISGVSDPPGVVRIYVETESDLAKLPPFIAGYSVEGVISGRFMALQRTGRYRPYPGGVSVGHYQITAGTLSSRVYDTSTKQRLILSNNHVLANSNLGKIGDPVYQPGTYDGGTSSDTIATLYKFVQIAGPASENLVDCALALPLNDSELLDEILDIGIVIDVEEAIVGMRVGKSGRTSGYTEATVQDVTATIKVYGYPFPEEYAIFRDQIITDILGQPGDSGSLVVNAPTRKAVGLLFAGSATLTALNKIRNVNDLLGITFGIPPPPPPPPQLAGMGWIPFVAILGVGILMKLGGYGKKR